MSKKVYVKENNLINLKNAMASESTSHSTFMSEDKPPYELDEFEIGGEEKNGDVAGGANRFHVNEGYCTSKLKSIDLSEVGKVECEVYSDEDDYNEWLQDNELVDSEETKLQFYTEEATYDVTYLDNETYHHMADDMIFYDDLEELFGEEMAKNVLNGCIKNGKYDFETYELYANNSYDLSNANEVNDIAMKLFRHGEYYKDCRGFILTNGVIVYTEAEHNEICMIPGVDTKFQFIEMGNIRLLPNSIDIGAEPTYEQEEVLRQVINSYSEEELYLDIFDNHNEIGAKYIKPDWRYVIGEIDRYYSEGIRPQGSNGLYENSIKENIEAEVEANQVRLDSFQKRSELAPKIWDKDKLNSRVRLKLLDIADDFWETVNINWVKPKGVVLMGSICNYNWYKHSDIDLHLQVDFSEIDDRKDFIQEYFNGKKNEWNNEHSNLKIFGFPVEVYVEDIDADTNSGGIYDLEENDWIKKPSKENIKPIGLNKYSIKNKSAKIMTDIDDLYDKFKITDDDAELRAIGKEAHELLKHIKIMRKKGLSRGGESDSSNITYKVLRRTGYMDKLWGLESELYDKLNSIDEVTDEHAGLILEYLEKEHSANLYDYFKWVNSASDSEKAVDILKNCPMTTLKYIGRMSRDYSEFDELYQQTLIDKNVINNEDFIKKFANIFDKDEFLLRGLISFCGFNGVGKKLPTWCLLKFNRVVTNEWCIHFCYDADSIVREGFKWGTSDINHLALTGAGAKKESEGYNFALPLGEESINLNKYGSFNPETLQRKPNREAVIFQVSGVEAFHKGDKEKQVIFWGPNAKNFIPIKFSGHLKKWCVCGANGRVLYSARTPSEILDWVLNNLPQYRNQIMFGKNGRSIKEEVVADGNADHNPFKKRWKHERETLINYLLNYGELMTSKENGKQYKVLFDEILSNRIGFNYCLCIQWNPLTMEPGNVIYVRAYDKFTRKIFRPQFDYRGYDNIQGTADDIV